MFENNNYDKKDVVAFLRMVRLKERKLEWIFKEKEKGIKNKDLAFLCGVKIRRFQQLYAKYKMTGKIPKLNKNRRPRTELSDENKELIDKAVEESLICGALKLRLWIKKFYGKNISHNKIHGYLLCKGISKEDKKKKKQRKYCRYERYHSFSLVHLDWHVSKTVKGKHVCAVEDDASRLILCGGEFNSEETIHSIKLMKQAIKFAYGRYSAIIRECNTDKGTQFYNSTLDKNGKRSLGEFELFLQKQQINHIPSRRNHPQTNGKKERWFRTYEENRHKFKSFNEFVIWYNDMIHLGLSRKEGITPNEAVINKLRPESILGLFLRLIE
ncbi:MAG: hypothetical protein ABIB47_02190 [Candidatus Woesearchaeota archaeon]